MTASTPRAIERRVVPPGTYTNSEFNFGTKNVPIPEDTFELLFYEVPDVGSTSLRVGVESNDFLPSVQAQIVPPMGLPLPANPQPPDISISSSVLARSERPGAQPGEIKRRYVPGNDELMSS
jgi:hypothetical protein